MPSNGDLPRYIHNELVGVYALLIRSRRSSTAAQIKFITNSNSNNNSNNSSTSFTTSFESIIIKNPHDASTVIHNNQRLAPPIEQQQPQQPQPHKESHSSTTTTTTTTVTARRRNPQPRADKHHWRNFQNHVALFNKIAKKLQIHKIPDDWYGVTADQVRSLGASGLLKQFYNDSLYQALVTIYPKNSDNKEIEWQPWKFYVSPSSASASASTHPQQRRRKVPNGFWRDPKNQRKFFDWIAPKLGVERVPDDWYKIDLEQLVRVSAEETSARGYRCSFIKVLFGGSLARALESAYPEFEWHPWQFPVVPRQL